MARILYGLSGLGYGHATRGKPILKELNKDHEVIILTDRCSYSYLTKHFSNVEKICTETMEFSNNKVDCLKTGLVNLKNLPSLVKSFFKTAMLIRRFKPDVIVNDFTYALNYLGFLFRVPVIGIDNESVVTETKIDIPKNRFWSYLRAYMIVKAIVPRTTKQLIPSFFDVDTKDEKKTVICKPLLREKIQKLKSKQGSHVIVYRYSDVGDQLVNVLSKLPGKFIVYGFTTHQKHYNNISFRKFGDPDYWKELASCKAIISYGGFSLIAEALYLKKPIFSIPIKGQFEQELNAHYIKKMGYGSYADRANEGALREFLGKLPVYRKNLQLYKNNNTDLLKMLKQEINLLTS